jgi:hypothetical protein
LDLVSDGFAVDFGFTETVAAVVAMSDLMMGKSLRGQQIVSKPR